METLTIFYDANCGLCTKFRAWLQNQPKRVLVEFLPYDSPAAMQKFPGLAALDADREIVVMADDGRWWQGAAAWNTCLWATLAYHEWSFRLSSSALQPLIRQVVRLVSENRLSISHILKLKSDASVAEALRSLPAAKCDSNSCSTL